LATLSTFHLLVNGQKTTAEIITKHGEYTVEYSAVYVFDEVAEVLEFDVSRSYRWSRPEYYIGQEIDIIVAKHNDEVYWTTSLMEEFIILCLVGGGFFGLIYYLFFKRTKEILTAQDS
jgi:hypothetical protein